MPKGKKPPTPFGKRGDSKKERVVRLHPKKTDKNEVISFLAKQQQKTQNEMAKFVREIVKSKKKAIRVKRKIEKDKVTQKNRFQKPIPIKSKNAKKHEGKKKPTLKLVRCDESPQNDNKRDR